MNINHTKSLWISLFLFTAITSWSQIISTVAGNGSPNYFGDGGQATVAGLNVPLSVALDASGNIYIGDYGNSRIRKVNSSGIISTFAGNGSANYSGDGGQATAAELNSPNGITVDWLGNVYIADTYNNRIRKVNTSGNISTFAGNGTQGFYGDGGQATNAEFYNPSGVAADVSGNIYIADYGNNVIRKINTSGIISTFAGNTIAMYSGDGGQATSAELHFPKSIAFDVSGNVYIADMINNSVRKVSTSGIISTFAGNGVANYSGDGGPATASELYNPSGVASDVSGNIYIGDFANNRVRKVNTSGIISTFAGNGSAGSTGDGGQATAAELYYPSGLTLDLSGDVYIADVMNNYIRKVTHTHTGTDEFSSSFIEVNVYPVPNNGSFTVMGVTQGQVVELYTSTGQMLETRHALSLQTSMQFDIPDLMNGIYLIRILNKDGAIVAQQKIIKIE